VSCPVARQATLGWHQTPSLPGYATAFDILDGVIRQLSGGVVPYSSAQPAIVSGIAQLPPSRGSGPAPVSRAQAGAPAPHAALRRGPGRLQGHPRVFHQLVENAPDERANAQLKTWKILTKLRCCPSAGQLARAIDVL
jgi:hypothetical protein